jgi:hypothetical protein
MIAAVNMRRLKMTLRMLLSGIFFSFSSLLHHSTPQSPVPKIVQLLYNGKTGAELCPAPVRTIVSVTVGQVQSSISFHPPLPAAPG